VRCSAVSRFGNEVGLVQSEGLASRSTWCSAVSRFGIEVGLVQLVGLVPGLVL